MIRILLISCLLCAPVKVWSTGKSFVFTPGMIEAYHHILALRLDKGAELLEKERLAAPSSPALAYVTDYLYFLRSFINEDVKAFDQEIADFQSRLKLIEAGDRTSPHYYYCQAELLVHQAALRFKFRDYTRGASNVRDAYLLLKKNIGLYPAFQPHYKSMGMLEVLVGTVPPKFTWVTNMLGMKGDIPGGMNRLEEFMNGTHPEPEVEMLKEEALFLYSFLQLHIVKEKEEAWKRVEAATRDYRQNLVHCYARASVGMHCKKNDEVIRTLENRPRGSEYAKFYFLDYLLGTAKLYKQDPGAASHFKTFVSLFRGENYIKDAYLKLAWSYLCANDPAKYKVYIGLTRRHGKENVDEDKQAMKEASSDEIPHTGLLRARLLFDGGYYDKALDIMTPLAASQWSKPRDRAEFHYRLARIYHEKGETDRALILYQQTIDLCRNESWYYAANSSLHMGYIYEERGDKQKAKACFQQAMNYPNDEYKNSIDQKAQAGLERLKT